MTPFSAYSFLVSFKFFQTLSLCGLTLLLYLQILIFCPLCDPLYSQSFPMSFLVGLLGSSISPSFKLQPFTVFCLLLSLILNLRLSLLLHLVLCSCFLEHHLGIFSLWVYSHYICWSVCISFILLKSLMIFMVFFLNSVFWSSSGQFSMKNTFIGWWILRGMYCLDLSYCFNAET